jgi:hypothetical protein
MPVLVKFSSDWADEFQVEGFQIMENQAEVDRWKEGVCKAIERGAEFSFGTNQYFFWESDKEFLRCIETKALSDFDMEELGRIFGAYHHGWVPEAPYSELDDEVLYI